MEKEKEITISYNSDAQMMHVQLKKQGIIKFNTAAVSQAQLDVNNVHRFLRRELINGDQAHEIFLKINDRLFMPNNHLTNPKK